MGLHETAMSKVLLRFTATIAIFTLCLVIFTGCRQAKLASNKEKGVGQSTKSKIIFTKNDAVYETDLLGSKAQKLFTVRNATFLQGFKYLPSKRSLIYLSPGDSQQIRGYTLREYSFNDKKDKGIDFIQSLISADDESGIFYTKFQNPTDNPNTLMPANSLFQYTPGTGTKSLGIQNIRQAIINTETAELCYVSFAPTEQATEPPSKIYVTKLNDINPQQIASFPENTWAVLVSFSADDIIFLHGKVNTSGEDAPVHILDRQTKRTRLIEDKAMPLAIDKNRKTILVAKKESNSLKDFSFYEIQYDSNTKNKLFQLTLKGGESGPLSAKYSPDGRYFVFLSGWDGNLGIYELSTRKYRTFFNEKDRYVRDFLYAADGKHVICTLGKPLTDSSIHEDTVYKIELESGKYMPIVKPSDSGGLCP